jgi:hypothetical protein
MSDGCAYETNTQVALTRLSLAASLLGVSKSENLAARLHVDLRRQASAICAVSL